MVKRVSEHTAMDWSTFKMRRMSDKEMNQLAKDIALGNVFITNTDEGMKNSFGFILMFLHEMPLEEAERIGALYEYIDKAGARPINGFPFFFGCKFVHVDDMQPLQELVEAKKAVLETL